jgi:Putative MetA-pathway of phenol degradation
MSKRPDLFVFLAFLFACTSASAQGPCSNKSAKLACVVPQEYGPGAFSAAGQGVFANQQHEGHFDNSISSQLAPLTQEIGRQANLLPLASPSSGFVFTFDPSLKTFVQSTDSLGPILSERAETVGRRRFFVGFSYQFFDFDKIDGVNLHNFPAIFVHADDAIDNNVGQAPNTTVCSINTAKNLNGCVYVRDLISSANSIDLKVNQYTSYVTFGLTRRIDLSLVIPVENVRMNLSSNDTIILGSNGLQTLTKTSTDFGKPQPVFDHLWAGCPNPSPSSVAALAPSCLNHVFPDPSITQGGSNPTNSATGIGDLVGRVKWNMWEGERAGVAAGVDVRFPSGDALNYLGSGAYGVKPFAIFSYRARVSPHVLVGYEWNSDSITSGDLTTGVKGSVPGDFVYSAGADAWVTKWLTGAFDVVGERVFGTQTLSVTPQQFLAPCGSCAAQASPATVAYNTLNLNSNQSYNITTASMGIKVRPLPKVSKLVFTANVLVRLDDGGLSSRPAPLVGVGYTF